MTQSTPASTYLLIRGIRGNIYGNTPTNENNDNIDDMCACISELEHEAGNIYCNDWVC